MQIKSYIAALMFGLLIVHPSFGQGKGDSSGPKQPQGEGAKQLAQSSLEDLLAKALKQNPEILVAETKVRAAEAELNLVRQQVMAKIATLYTELVAARDISKEAEMRFVRLKELARQGNRIVTEEELGTAELIMLKYKAEQARKEAELPLLIGKKTAGLSRAQSKELDISSDGLWVDEVKLTLDKWVDLKKPTADKVRAALEAQIKVNYNKVPLEEVLENLQSLVKGVNLYLAAREFKKDSPVTAKLAEPVSLLAVLQLLEDTTGLRFIVREYGIVAVDRSNLPPGALSVSDFARQPAEKTSK